MGCVSSRFLGGTCFFSLGPEAVICLGLILYPLLKYPPPVHEASGLGGGREGIPWTDELLASGTQFSPGASCAPWALDQVAALLRAWPSPGTEAGLLGCLHFCLGACWGGLLV